LKLRLFISAASFSNFSCESPQATRRGRVSSRRGATVAQRAATHDDTLVDATQLVDQVTGGGRLAAVARAQGVSARQKVQRSARGAATRSRQHVPVDVADNDNVHVQLLLAHGVDGLGSPRLAVRGGEAKRAVPSK